MRYLTAVDVIDLTRELCTIPSITGNEADVVDRVASLLTKLGLDVQRQRVPDAKAGDVKGRDNLLATVKGRAPDVLLTTHLDTVPPFIAPRIESVNGVDTLFGRGVIDAKGIASSMLCAAERILARGEERVGLLFVVGEETNSDGAKYAANGFVPKIKAFIDGEPTDNVLVHAMKGVLAFELHVDGKAAHSAYPEAGHSAVHQLLADLAKLTGEPWPHDDKVGQTTLNVGVVNGGVAPNVLAPFADAICVMRTTKDADMLEQRIRALLSPSTQMAVRTKSSPQFLRTLPGVETKAVAFGSDVPHLSPLVPSSESGALLVGPGSILDAHTDRERITVADLRASVDAYEKLALQLL
jgi:acetylornithine deacetylase